MSEANSEANSSKQMGQHKKKIFHQMFLRSHKGWQRFVSWLQIVIVLLEYKEKEIRKILRGCSRDRIEADSWFLFYFTECDVLLVANAEFQE